MHSLELFGVALSRETIYPFTCTSCGIRRGGNLKISGVLMTEANVLVWTNSVSFQLEICEEERGNQWEGISAARIIILNSGKNVRQQTIQTCVICKNLARGKCGKEKPILSKK